MATLYKKLQEHFDIAAGKLPAGKPIFEAALRFSESHISDERLSLPMKGLVYKVSQVESSFEEDEKIVQALWEAQSIITAHKGPKI